MGEQRTFSSLAWSQKGKVTRRERLLAEMDAVIPWVTSDELPLGGVVKGRDAVLGNFAQIPNYWSEFSVTPEEFIDGGDWVIVRGTQKATGKGGSFEAPFAHLLKVVDGKTVRGEFHGDSAKALKALG